MQLRSIFQVKYPRARSFCARLVLGSIYVWEFLPPQLIFGDHVQGFYTLFINYNVHAASGSSFNEDASTNLW
jgi:hypothetical protein